ncbi:MAG: ABC transporter ATP-binding protein [Rhodospirillales bacterium]|nr:ABC transporter ATP-binding protein [Rhodospirillales bacterium]
MISIFKKISAFLDKRSRFQLLLLFVPMLGVALLEMASIAMILPFIQSLMAQGDTVPTLAFGERLLSGVPIEQRLYVIAGLFSAVFVIKNAALFVMIFIINRTIQRKLALFSQGMFSIYLHRPLAFHLQRNSAEIIRNLQTSSPRAFESIRVMLMMSLEFMLVLVAFALLLMFEPAITLIAAGALLAYGLLFHRIAGPYFQRWGRNSQIIEGQMIKTVSESLGSIRDIKLLHIQDYMQRVYAEQTEGLAKYISRTSTSQHIPRLSVETLVILGFAGVVVGLMIVKGSLQEVVAALGLFAMASLRLMPSMNRILTGAADLRNRLAAVDILYDDFVNAKDDGDLDYVDCRKEDLPFEQEISINDLTFSYANLSDAAITNTNLLIRRGSSIGIVGPSGAGKSTLLDLLLGLLEPQAGSITVDGMDIKTNIGAWQKHLGYVPQSIYLIDDTLRHNIAFGTKDDEINEQRVAVAVELSNLGAVIGELEDGLNTYLGEGGSRLSGGQRQRVAIARALYRDPDVLIFDEATSALDIETEREITSAIERLKGEKTIIIISHKLSIVSKCDEVVFMSDGKVEAKGPMESLITSNDRFRKFADADSDFSGR